MGLFSIFMGSITKNKVSEWIPDIDFGDEVAQRVYLKNMAKATVLNFVARTMSTLKVEFKNKKNSAEWEYILNLKPNKDMSASSFWEKFFYRLLDENEVLVIFTDDNQLLIADDYSRKEYAVYEDVFQNVTVKDYTFTRNFRMSEVIFLEFNNEKLDKFAKGLFDDYGELFGRIFEVAMRNNQIRATVDIETTGSFNDEKDANGKTRAEKIQDFIDKIYTSFRKSSVAIVPKMKGLGYEEHTNKQGVSNQSLEELDKMKDSLIDDVANAIGVPTALIYGEKAELDQNIKAFRKTLLVPLMTKLQDELLVKIIEKREYIAGERILIKGVLPKDIIDDATQIDKAVSSSAFELDEVRAEFEYSELRDGKGKKIIRTKNYEEVKGGEEKDDNAE